MSILTKQIKKLANIIGYEIVRLKNHPKFNFLGLPSYDVKTIIDVGANIGQFAEQILLVYPEASVYSFEPLPEPYRKLKKIADASEGKITASNIAIGDATGKVEMFYHTKHSPSSSLLKTTDLTEDIYPFTKDQSMIQVPIQTLDDVLHDMEKEFENDVLIKLDVQGFEDRVIRGGSEAFKRAKICLLEVSLDKLYDDQANFKDLMLLLYDLGYQYSGNLDQTYAEDGHCIFLDAVFIRQ